MADRAASGTPLACELEVELPGSITVGRGNHLLLRGRCYHPDARIRRLQVVIAGRAHEVETHSLAVPEILGGTRQLDERGHVLTSRFWTAVPIEPVASEQDVDVVLRAELRGREIAKKKLGTIRLCPAAPAPPAELSAGPARVVICMPTYDPDLDMLRSQLASISAQAHQDWICIINDDASPAPKYEAILDAAALDPRFVVYRNKERLGMYGNFERTLELAPAGAEFIAFADQDDVWYPNKLADSLAAFDEETTLVYSDMQILDRDGNVVSDTFWLHRKNNHTDLAMLLVANTITGAASTFRASLIPHILPFPPDTGVSFVDQWIAAVALTRGRVRFIDEPLYGYRQHGQNVIGYDNPSGKARPRTVSAILRQLPSISRAKRVLAAQARQSPTVVGTRAAQVAVVAKSLALRTPELDGRHGRAVKTMSKADRSLVALMGALLRFRFTGRDTVGRDSAFLWSAILLRLLTMRFRFGSKKIAAQHSAAIRTVAGGRSDAPVRTIAGRRGTAQPTAQWIERYLAKIQHDMAPMKLRISADAPARINLVVPMIDFRYVFGAYLTIFQAALALCDHGERVRILIVQQMPFEPLRWEQELRAYPGLENLLQRVEIEDASDREREVEVSANDAFVATNSWTAHVAAHGARAVGRERFAFMILEYDPITFPTGSLHELSAAAYRAPHDAIFSTELLRDYFRSSGLGVYTEGTEIGDAHSVAVDNPIAIQDVRADAIAERSQRGLLLYARVEEHARRNLFEMAVFAMREVIERSGSQLDGWKIDGIGSLEELEFALGPKRRLNVMPRQTLDGYMRTLGRYDVGLALQATPHPGLVALDMASAGLVTVTNAYATKTTDRLAAISDNIVAVDLTVDAIARGLEQAIERSADFAAREAGAKLNWPRSWPEALGPQVVDQILAFPSLANR